MARRYLCAENKLPNGFAMPAAFVDFVESGTRIDLEPWWFLCDHPASADFWLDQLRKQYPERALVPFAKLQDTDDVACFDGADFSSCPGVLYIHAFASPGREMRGEAEDFSVWPMRAISDHERYASER